MRVTMRGKRVFKREVSRKLFWKSLISFTLLALSMVIYHFYFLVNETRFSWKRIPAIIFFKYGQKIRAAECLIACVAHFVSLAFAKKLRVVKHLPIL